MDICDQAKQQAELLLNTHLKHAHRAECSARPDGYCLCCGESVSDGRRWCDAQCRDDWQSENGWLQK